MTKVLLFEGIRKYFFTFFLKICTCRGKVVLLRRKKVFSIEYEMF